MADRRSSKLLFIQFSELFATFSQSDADLITPPVEKSVLILLLAFNLFLFRCKDNKDLMLDKRWIPFCFLS